MSAFTYPAERAELIAELERERARADAIANELEGALARLGRLEHHMRHGIFQDVLSRLADYAANACHEHVGDPQAADPYPDPPPPAKPAKRRRRGL